LKPRSVRAELIRLVASAVVPLFVFSLAVATWDASVTRRAVETGLEETARALSVALARSAAARSP
jgi:hypothetical protein